VLSQAGSQGLVITVMYEGWLVWDGVYGPVELGAALPTTVEFLPRTPVVLSADREPTMRHLAKNRYQVTAKVLDATDAVVLDLGPLRVLKWVRPGETAGDFTAGEMVTLEVALGLNPWDETPWTTRAISQHHAETRLRVERITLWGLEDDFVTELTEATTDTVDSATEYCLLECQVLH